MDKTAQKRSLLNKLHEMANVPARSAENFFKPELKRVMETLINADDVVRSTLAGQRIGKATPEDPVSAKDLLKEAKSFVNRREYLSAVASLGRFHKKMNDVAQVLKGLNLNVNNIHHRFLFDKLPTKHKEQLESMRGRFASQQEPYFIKEANIMDFFHNIGTQRGRALAAWEKRYPKVVGKIREGAQSQLESSENLLNTVLSELKVMASHRASRNIDAYLNSANEVVSAINKYDTGKDGFRNYYNNVIKPYLDTQARLETEEAAQNIPVVDPSKVVTDDKDSTVPAAPLDEAFKSPVPSGSAPPSEFGRVSIPVPSGTPSTMLPAPPKMPTDLSVPPAKVPSLPGAAEKSKLDQVHEDIMKEWEEKNKGTTAAYKSFVESLNVFSEEDPTLLAAHISKYARSIQADDPATAIRLFKIAKSLRG